ncbi:hypothetical protein [Xenorhabdus bharatensis]|uniref:hypothetical protein n=1 Tax=Xenorhabdus bharatensis TaxID=3136256 RepID=UPI0030F3E406
MDKDIVLPVMYNDHYLDNPSIPSHESIVPNPDNITKYYGMVNVDNVTLENVVSSDVISPDYDPYFKIRNIRASAGFLDGPLNRISTAILTKQNYPFVAGLICDDLQMRFTAYSNYIRYTQFTVTTEGYYIYEEVVPKSYYKIQHIEVPHGNIKVIVSYNALYFDVHQNPLFIGSPAIHLDDNNTLTLTHIFPTKPQSAHYFQTHLTHSDGIYLDYTIHGLNGLVNELG